MSGDAEGWSEVGYHEHAAASGPRSQSQRSVSSTTNTHCVFIKATMAITITVRVISVKSSLNVLLISSQD